MSAPFDYPPAPHVRRHGPLGYADYASYRPWLRDEFSFRCVYCLLREQWGRVRGLFDLDHFQPAANRPDLALDYDNLLYTCATCNSIKRALEISDPLSVLIQANVRVSEDGRIHTDLPEAACLIEILGLNSEETVEFRMTWIGIIALAAADLALYRKLMGFPNDLPDLNPLRPPAGNKRPEGVTASHHARRHRGELPETY
ncbi:MAG TPA: HNH endonuclease [Gemmataceae bacterium]|nr:HNH endonuclease [Gemmataceae bacterium]